MKNRALMGLSAACMSALVVTAIGCGQPAQKTYTPDESTGTAASSAKAASSKADTKVATSSTSASSSKSEASSASSSSSTSSTAAASSKADGKATTAAAASSASEAAGSASASSATYADGTYTASSKGIGGDVPVTVTIEGGKIASVEVGDNSETPSLGGKAIETLPAEIVAANGTDGVDAYSGATVTSTAIFTAVEDCLSQASAGGSSSAASTTTAAASSASDSKATTAAAASSASEAAGSASASSATYADGTYTASSKGIGGDVPVTVTIEGGKIASVEVGDNDETEGVGSKAIDQLPSEIVAANGTDGVEAVSGASVTSKAIFTAVEACLEEASNGSSSTASTSTETAASSKADSKATAASSKADSKATAASSKADSSASEAAGSASASSATYADGTYTASSKGIGGDVP
ncbi:MAG: FMN-binding protein, partial [Coriobacteriales bacterium]